MRCLGFTIAIALLTVSTSAASEDSLGASSAQSTTQQEKDAACRNPRHDGLNCLFLQLKTMGYDGGYEQFADRVALDQREPTLQTLSIAAKQLGFQLTPSVLTWRELLSLNAPVI